MIQGVDLSAYQPLIDWRALITDPLAPRFAYIKFTEGNGWVSKYARGQWHGARALGADFFVGPYHFCRWDSPGDPIADAVDEADHFFDVVGALAPGDLPPVADVEWISEKKRDPDELVAWVRAFLARCEQRFGRVPMIYTGPSFWRYCLLPDKRDLSLELTAYPLWQVDYNAPAGRPKVMSGTAGTTEKGSWTWTFHQYSGHGRVRGVMDRFGRPTNTDLNVFNGTLEDLRLLALLPSGG